MACSAQARLGRAIRCPEKREFGDVNVTAPFERTKRQRLPRMIETLLQMHPMRADRLRKPFRRRLARSELRFLEDGVADLDQNLTKFLLWKMVFLTINF